MVLCNEAGRYIAWPPSQYLSQKKFRTEFVINCSKYCILTSYWFRRIIKMDFYNLKSWLVLIYILNILMHLLESRFNAKPHNSECNEIAGMVSRLWGSKEESKRQPERRIKYITSTEPYKICRMDTVELARNIWALT